MAVSNLHGNAELRDLLINRLSHDENLLEVASLVLTGHAGNPHRWGTDADVFVKLAERLLTIGQPLVAYDVLEEGRKRWPDNVRLKQLLALGLARSGATHRAKSILDELQVKGHCDAETLGLLARTYKDLFRIATDEKEKRSLLSKAHEAYLDAYKDNPDVWVGINAATTGLLLGKDELSAELADEIHRRCADQLAESPPDSDRYWQMATLGESSLVRGNWEEAKDWYSRAGEIGNGRWADLASSRRNAKLLVEHLGKDWRELDRCFNMLRVAVFVGHMVDRPSRKEPRFPAELESLVLRRIGRRLSELNARVGYVSAACGGDILFLEAMRDQGGETHIVLPYPADAFIQDSVEIEPDGNWTSRFNAVLRAATSVEVASHSRPQHGSIAYEFVGQMIYGLAAIRARQLDADLAPMALWDGESGDGPGGTASVVRCWQAMGHEVEIINPAEFRGDSIKLESKKPATVPGPQCAWPKDADAEVCGLLFADVVGFSKLTESQLPPFVEHFLGLVAEQISKSPREPLMRNTWGDALFCVFQSIAEAGVFALNLCRQVNITDWQSHGLPSGLTVRIALHAGPVYPCIDPVTGTRNYIGNHVSQTARIEPITPPGHVYASQAFAALAAAEHVREFACDYVGQMPLAKGSGTMPLFHVRML